MSWLVIPLGPINLTWDASLNKSTHYSINVPCHINWSTSQLVYHLATPTTRRTSFRNLVVDLTGRPLETPNLVDKYSGWLGTQLGQLFYCRPIFLNKNKNKNHYDFFYFLPFNHHMTVSVQSNLVQSRWIVRDCQQQSWMSHPLRQPCMCPTCME